MTTNNCLRRGQALAPDWGRILSELLEVDGMDLRKIAVAMGFTALSESMLRSYLNGVQPLYWRGDAMVRLWCATMKKGRNDVPMIPVVHGRWRGRRRVVDKSPELVDLPNWPAVPPATGAEPTKRKRKVAA